MRERERDTERRGDRADLSHRQGVVEPARQPPPLLRTKGRLTLQPSEADIRLVKRAVLKLLRTFLRTGESLQAWKVIRARIRFPPPGATAHRQQTCTSPTGAHGGA